MGQNNSAPADRPPSPNRLNTPLIPQEGQQRQGRLRSLFPSRQRQDQPQNPPSSLGRSLSRALTRTHVTRRPRDTPNADEQQDEQIIDESEERPLRGISDLRMPATPINNISAAPLPRPRSMISRAASHIHHRYSTISYEEGPYEQTILREANHDTTRNSTQGFSSIRRRVSTMTRRRSMVQRSPSNADRLSISRPILSHADSSLDPDFAAEEALRRAPTPGDLLDQTGEDGPMQRRARASRMSSFRRSIGSPRDLYRDWNTSRQRRTTPSNESGRGRDEEDQYLLPPIDTQGHRLDIQQHTIPESDAATEDAPTPPQNPNLSRYNEPYPRQFLWQPPAIPLDSVPRRRQTTAGNAYTEYIRDPFATLRRTRRTGENAPLGRVLQLTATAIAAQLSGHPAARTNLALQSIGDYQFDARFHEFMEELNRAPGAPRQPRDENTPPLNFWRMFRFDDNNGSSPNTNDAGEDRSVTVVVVGVQSVPSSSIAGDASLDPNLEALFENMTQRPVPNFRNHGLGRRATTRGIPAPAFEQPNHSRNIADVIDFGPQRSTAHESPPGPYPPPSTPAERLSLGQSNATTATLVAATESTGSRRFSLRDWTRRRTSTVHAETGPLNMDQAETSSADGALGQNTPPSPVRRRRSDSETARTPHLRRDDRRRHGVVGSPHDNGDPNGSGRSWLIYVIGSRINGDNPLLATPNLFDINVSHFLEMIGSPDFSQGNPMTYEEMLQLSELIGVAVPPTATEADVEAAGGVFVAVRKANGDLIAEAISGQEAIELGTDAACSVCQDGYAAAAEIRRLWKCPHIFHKDCIDAWLTNGKNSCPLCRKQGVEIKDPARNRPTYGSI